MALRSVSGVSVRVGREDGWGAPEEHGVQTERVLAGTWWGFETVLVVAQRGDVELDVGRAFACRQVLWLGLRWIFARREEVWVVAADERCGFTDLQVV